MSSEPTQQPRPGGSAGRSLRPLLVVTWATLGLTGLVAVLSQLGARPDMVHFLFITEYLNAGLVEVKSGQIWRLVTPALLHFGILHLVFNSAWIWQLGGQIERVEGSKNLLILVLISALAGNLFQYFMSGPNFGGLSGVVYALVGYLFLRPRLDPGYPLRLPDQLFGFLMLWFVLCWTGLLGPIGNWAHSGGLLVGFALAFLRPQFRRIG